MEIESLRGPNDRSYNSDLEVQRVLDAIGYTSVDLCTLQKRTQIELSRLKSILDYVEWIDLVTRGLGGRLLCRCMARSQKIRSEEHTSELQSLMRPSYAVFCLNKQRTHKAKKTNHIHSIHYCHSDHPHY